jgi:hypothetical protein
MMTLESLHGTTKARPAPRPVATRTERRIALCGSHSASLVDAPWDDPRWEFWGHAASRAWYARPMHRLFDLHLPSCRDPKLRGRALYLKWLQAQTTPIYMQKQYPDIPASVAYPKGRILTEFSYAHRRHYFSNQVAWMIALAITEGVTELALYGVNYSADSEYATQRGSAEYWLGQLDGRGVTVRLPEQCSLLAVPSLLYGYQSHDEVTGALADEYKPRQPKRVITPIEPGQPVKRAQPPAELLAEIAAEEKAHPRPDYARLPDDFEVPPAEAPEVVVATDDGVTRHGQGISVRIHAPGEPGEQVAPGEGMRTWTGHAMDLREIDAQEPSRSLQHPSNGASHVPLSPQEGTV